MMQRVFTADRGRRRSGGGARCGSGWSAPTPSTCTAACRTTCCGLADALRGRGHDVGCSRPARRRHHLGLRHDHRPPHRRALERLGRPGSTLGPLRPRGDAGLAARRGFDVLHLHEPVDAQRHLARAAGARVPVVGDRSTPPSDTARVMRLGAATASRGVRGQRRCVRTSRSRRRRAARWPATAAPSRRVIPNGLDRSRLTAAARPATTGRARLLFLGRVDEPRKGLSVAAAGHRRDRSTGTATPGSTSPAGTWRVAGRCARLPADVLGPGRTPSGRSTTEKARLLGRADVVRRAPHRRRELRHRARRGDGGRAAVVASDLPAFAGVLGDGRHGVLFAAGDAADLRAAPLDRTARRPRRA